MTNYRVISDHLGSPVMAVNVNDASDVPFAAEYTSFGERRVATGTSSESWLPFGFAGGLYDADTTLVRFGARDYDAVIGRWPSKDELRFVASRNLYEYVWNDPVNLVDLTGLAPSNGAGGATSTGCGGSEGASSTGAELPKPSKDEYTVDWCGSGENSKYIPETLGTVNYGNACKTHDECYSTCGEDKSRCDLNLSYHMAIDCTRQGGGAICNFVSGLYGTAVDWFGNGPFTNAQASCPSK